jgi:predicted CXXCH cytochrome family protein
MHYKALIPLLFTLFLAPQIATAAGTQQCLSCHDFGPESPVHPILGTPHGDTESGCEACHGPSDDHMSRPTITAPDVSYGPRWSAAVAAQDNQCLDCHQEDVAAHWQDALHMANNFTCVTCHELHTDKDPVLQPGGQSEVCTVCHKTQKDGIHALHEKLDDNPNCTTCHNPHADQSPIGKMLSNRSEGCRNCHDLVAMSKDAVVTDKAKSYHRVMVQEDRTCLDCHQGVAHGPADAVEPFLPMAVSQRDVTLFYPGQSDISWILSEHPGSQPFRQGSNCQQCHRGEEANMGESLGDNPPTSRMVNVGFNANANSMQVNLSWQGSKDDADIAFMWGDGTNTAFRRGGCFAACHSDMPGMSRDRGLDLGKYLADSRSQQQRIGQPPITRTAAELKTMMAAGNFVELWRIDLQKSGKAEIATLLSGLDWIENSGVKASSSFKDGTWTVTINRPITPTPPLKRFMPGKRYTFGMALHGANRTGAEHWVSLPMTLSLDGDDTDFLAD